MTDAGAQAHPQVHRVPPGVELIGGRGVVTAILVTARAADDGHVFVTPPQDAFQLGLLSFPEGHVVARHVHNKARRAVDGTAEVVIVRRGRCLVDVYDDDRLLLATRELREGDAILFCGGGHGLRMLGDTELLEIKQGPYFGDGDKQRF